MGLAASQARLLTITARKSDCEFLSMSLSHQKLSLARDMEKVSSDYQNALSQTKLVYDYHGSGDTSINLDYGLLMTPSIYNDYYPKTVTDADNRVILNSSYAAAARAAGIPVEGLEGTPSDSVRNAFVEALAGAGVITATRAASIEAVTYGNSIGLGSTSNVTASYTQVSYDELLDMFQASTEKNDDAGVTFGSSTDNIKNRFGADYDWGDQPERLTVYDSKDLNKAPERHDGDGASASFNIGDLLKGDKQYVLSMESIWGERTPVTTTMYLQDKLLNGDDSFLQWMTDQFTTVLGGYKASETAIQYASNAVYNLLYPNSDLQQAGTNMYNNTHSESAHDRKHHTEPNDGSGVGNLSYRNIMEEIGVEDPSKIGNGYDSGKETLSNGVLGFYFTCARNGSGKTRKQTSESYINLNNLAQVFLTAYVEYMEGIDNTAYNYKVGNLSESNLYDPKRSDFQFTVAGQTEVDSDDDNLYANFYDALFNQICMNGWTENEQIEDVDYMTGLFKNGLAFISSIAEDGYYYQGSYSTDRAILEVSDESAIAVAEAKYNTEKTKIENKEDKIDMKMKNLDTEISSLTTEYDSTKQIITKAVEKSFKRYEA